MKKLPPKIPDIYIHEYNLNKNIKTKNETYGKITKGTIPSVFFGHLMIEKKQSITKSCITQRNKKKLLTIVYYAPWYYFVFICMFDNLIIIHF